MEFVILGSGGCVSLPKPLCKCPVCVQARQIGAPYARCGCSLYCVDARLVIDTPEDIAYALNAADIDAVDIVAYSHWDPDHTLGMRIFEQLRLDWLAHSVGTFHPTPVRVMALDGVLADVKAIANKFGSFLSYYEHMGLVTTEAIHEGVTLGDIRLTLVPVDDTRSVTVFVFEQNGRRLVYAPCDVKPFPDSPLLEGAEVLIIGNTMVGPVLKNGFTPAADNPLAKELFSLEEVLALKARYGIGRLIVTHLEEDWGKSYDDYKALEAEQPDMEFAYDGMRITV